MSSSGILHHVAFIRTDVSEERVASIFGVKTINDLYLHTSIIVFGPKRDGVTGGWRKLHNEELHHLYSSPSIIGIITPKRMMWAGHVARIGEKRNVYTLLVRKPKGKRPLEKPRRRWTDNIKMDLIEIAWGVWTGLLWLRLGTSGELLFMR
jgi:hypothetical protein